MLTLESRCGSKTDDLLLISLKLAKRRAAGRSSDRVRFGLGSVARSDRKAHQSEVAMPSEEKRDKGRESKSKENPCAISSGLSNRSYFQSSLLR